MGLSLVSHGAAIALVLLIIRFAPTVAVTDSALVQMKLPDQIVWLAEPGPGGGGGGGGNRSLEPPRKAELPGKDKLTVPVVKPEPIKFDPKPEKLPDEPKQEPLLNIPAKSMAEGTLMLPGTFDGAKGSTSQGSGSGGGAGTGNGTGIGPGQGSGLGPGWGGGFGGGAYRPGAGIELPRPIRQVQPQYTAEAMRAKVQGIVVLECVVMPDGTVAQVQVIRSLDPVFGLDQEAIKAARQWRFIPGMRQGQPVPVIVSIEMTFGLR
jgi:TonB family protein